MRGAAQKGERYVIEEQEMETRVYYLLCNEIQENID